MLCAKASVRELGELCRKYSPAMPERTPGLFYDFRPSSRSRQRSNGAKPSSLERTRVTPRTEDRGPIKSACSVSRTTGTVGIVFLNTFAASRPFICGIARSMSTKSGLSSLARLIASTPLEASPHTRNSVRDSMAVRIAVRSLSMSSTTRTVLTRSMSSCSGAVRCPDCRESDMLARMLRCVCTTIGSRPAFSWSACWFNATVNQARNHYQIISIVTNSDMCFDCAR